MTSYCKVRGRWTGAISDINTTCRYYSPRGCQKKGACTWGHKTTDPNAQFIGKTVKDVTDDSLVFEDGSVFRFGMSKELRRVFAEAGIV